MAKETGAGRLVRATRRFAVATGRAARMGLRMTMAATGTALMLGSLLLIHPLGQILPGVPVFAVGFLLVFKAVFW